MDAKQLEADLRWDLIQFHNEPEIVVEQLTIDVEDEKIEIKSLISIGGKKPFNVDASASWRPEVLNEVSKEYLYFRCMYSIVEYVREMADKELNNV